MTVDTSLPHGSPATYGSPFEAPDGPALIRWLATDSIVRVREISDGRHAITYADTERLLEQIDPLLARWGATTEHPIALECSQSVAGAPWRPAPLSRQYNVVLLPDAGRPIEGSRHPTVHPQLLLARGQHRGGSAPHRTSFPEDGIECATNEAFAEEPALAGFTGPDLYLRTSGSTGIPKLARMSHQRWLNNALACVHRWRLTARRPAHRAGAHLPQLRVRGRLPAGPPRRRVDGPWLGRQHPALPRKGGALRARRRVPDAGHLRDVPGRVRNRRGAIVWRDRRRQVKRETMTAFEPRFGPLLNLYGSAEMGAVSSAAPHDPPATAPRDGRLSTAKGSSCASSRPARTTRPRPGTGRHACNAGSGTASPATSSTS